MSDCSDKDSDLSNKISQTIFPNYSNISLVNSRIYSPLPDPEQKHFPIVRRKLKTSFKSPDRPKLPPTSFRLPGMAADQKELISPFSIRGIDYVKLYTNNTPVHLEFIGQPSLIPTHSPQKRPRRLKTLKAADTLCSKKLLTVRDRKKTPKHE